MGISDIVAVFGAVALFLFGMTTMTDGLERLSSGKLESILEKLTNSTFKGVLLGALVTGLIQSSAATTVMCVGFVNAGIMKLRQTVGVIMGANIGTTVTAQLLRLGDISTDNLVLQFLSPEFLGPILAVVGVILFMFVTKGHKKDIGQIVLGLGILFIGMNFMKDAVAPLKELPEFQKMFTAFSNPVLGIIVGAVITALLQSSSASVGILQTVSSTGAVTFSSAAPLIMGQNIGTCITALISAIGASKNAKRTAMLHLLFNIIGTIVFIILLYAGNAIFKFDFWETTMSAGSIASIHLFFNVACTMLLMPFGNLLVKIATRIVPGGAEEREVCELDERFLATPALAIERANSTVVQMGEFAKENYALAVELLEHYDIKKQERLNETEAAIDKMEGLLDSYLVKLTDRALSSEESMKVSELLHTLSDFERIGDYVVNLSESAAALHGRGISFSQTAKAELAAITGAVGEAVDKAVECFSKESSSIAFEVEPIEEVVDVMQDALKSRHIERLKDGECTIELGTQFLELLINLERISDHCSNVAMYMLRQKSAHGDLIRHNAHEYFHELHHGGNEEFDRMFAQYKEKYLSKISE